VEKLIQSMLHDAVIRRSNSLNLPYVNISDFLEASSNSFNLFFYFVLNGN
jgi:hypothetical protein